MGKIAEWIWPEIRDLKSHNSMLEAGIKVQQERIAALETENGILTMQNQKYERERYAFIKPHTPEVLRNLTAAQIRRMTEKEGERDV